MPRFAGRSHVDKAMIDKIVVRNSLRLMDMTKFIFGGTCPLCGQEKSFILWSETGRYRCYWCGCDGRFVIAPERLFEERQKEKEILNSMEV